LQAEIEYSICKCVSTTDNGWLVDIKILSPFEGSLKFTPHLDANFEIMYSTYLKRGICLSEEVSISVAR